MSDRTPEQILAEWRECERAHVGAPSAELANRIEALRLEHSSAIAEGQIQAAELAEISSLRSA